MRLGLTMVQEPRKLREFYRGKKQVRELRQEREHSKFVLNYRASNNLVLPKRFKKFTGVEDVSKTPNGREVLQGK